MKQYDKIWVPSTSPHPFQARAINGFYYKPQEGQVVMSMDELRAIFQNTWEERKRMGQYLEAQIAFSKPISNLKAYNYDTRRKR